LIRNRISIKGQKIQVTGKINSEDDNEVSLIERRTESMGYNTKDSKELQKDLDDDEEYENRKGIASFF
jgi:hypothetical protein